MMSEMILASVLWSVVQVHAAELPHRLDRLLTPARVLYVAAHPDDENTQLLTYFTHGRQVRTAYLSLTRGDGGQNLIGSEQSPLMGVIRTHELLEARKIDGAEQLFTRARDFGYSKRSDEALKVWGHEQTLGDVVWAMRRFRPHLVITRFPEEGSTHGHHLASAILAREAFEAAADPKRFPEQLERVAPWQGKRLVFNVPDRFMPEEVREDDLVVDIGGYDPITGESHGEIAAASRSMHKSQGFGAARRFGPEEDRFRHIAGERAETDLLENIPTTWSDVEGGEAVGRALKRARDAYRPESPGDIVAPLTEALAALDDVADEGLRRWAHDEIATLLIAASGLLLEARAPEADIVAGDATEVELTVLRRGTTPVWLTSVALLDAKARPDVELGVQPHVEKLAVTVPKATPPSRMPWLIASPGPGRYRGEGDPEVPLAPPSLAAELTLAIAGTELKVTVPVRQVRVDRVRGELHRDVEILPAISATPAAKSLLVLRTGNQETQLRVSLRVRKPGTVTFQAPEGYTVTPASLSVDKDQEVLLTVTAEQNASPGRLRITAGGASWAEHPMLHPHVPERTVLLPAEVALTAATVTVPEGLVVGHVAGPGDEVADGLRRLGMKVEDLDDEALAHGDLSRFDAIVVGVRAFNTREALRKHHDRLFTFAEAGGTVVVQYVTKPRGHDLDVSLLPYAMKLGRGRVTDETATVTMLKPDHPLLTYPHALGKEDFDGWVQERGLYFGASWDEAKVTPLLSLADPGEDPEQGALLVADHGSGRVIYCGLSLFRQFPAGVPGAHRLMVNLLTPKDHSTSADEPPPVGRRWRNLYGVVLVILLVLIGSFWLLTRRYAA